MKSLLVLVMGLMLCGCVSNSNVQYAHYTERGWVRQVWFNIRGFSYIYSITLEREYPKGEMTQIEVNDGRRPSVWQGQHVSIEIQQQSKQGVIILSVNRLE